MVKFKVVNLLQKKLKEQDASDESDESSIIFEFSCEHSGDERKCCEQWTNVNNWTNFLIFYTKQTIALAETVL